MSEQYFDFECPSWNDLPEYIERMNSCITEKVIPIQNSSNHAWEEIRVEIWEDSGRIIAYPATQKFEERTDIAGTQIICGEVIRDYEEIIYSSLSEEIQQKQVKIIFANLVLLIKNHLAPIAKYPISCFSSFGDKIEI